jgi:Arf-GAP/SH3 domain/ANK repeat/PH domain-containing protein
VCFRTVRKEYITAKYVDHRFSRKTCASSSAKLNELLEAIKSRDLLALIQVYAEGVELMEPLLEPGQVMTQRSERIKKQTVSMLWWHTSVISALGQSGRV